LLAKIILRSLNHEEAESSITTLEVAETGDFFCGRGQSRETEEATRERGQRLRAIAEHP
jgi:hypothetical protein